MIKSKLIIRRLLKSKSILLINIAGLSIAFCAVLYLSSYIIQEQSYDKHIPNHEQIYRLLTFWQEGEEIERMPINMSEDYIGIKASVPEVEEVTQVLRQHTSTFKLKDQYFTNKFTFAVNPNFLKVFRFKVIYGAIESALDSPEKIVISQLVAQKLFGKRDPIGETVIMDNRLSVVSAVIENVPDNTHFFFDALRPMTLEEKSYSSFEYLTYILFKANVDYQQAALKCERHYNKELRAGYSNTEIVCSSKAEPIADIHLKTVASWDMKENGNLTLITFLAILSIAILVIALSNYINLIMAQKESYIKQVSVQKILGTCKSSLVKQFFIESLFILTVAFLVAIAIFSTGKDTISNLIGVRFLDTVWHTWHLYMLLACIFIVSVVIACVYPALRISTIKITDLIHSHQMKTKNKAPLLVFQFSLVIFLITGILIVHKQISFIENKPKGYTADNVVNFWRITDKLISSWDEVKAELQNIPHVVAVTGEHAYPGAGGSGQMLSYKNRPAASVNEARVKTGYLEVFGIQLKEGRFFEKDDLDDDNLVVNEATIRTLGITDPIGAKVGFGEQTKTIIGVVKDYHYSSLKERIQPLMLTNWQNTMWTFSFKLDGINNNQTIEQIASVLKRFDKDYQVRWHYFEDELKYQYAEEHALRRIFYLGTSLGLIIALIGLFAYATVLSSRRTKEIGIRKVNGASMFSIVYMLSKSFLSHILIAFTLACPIAWYAMDKWLCDFAYKISLSWWIFALAGVLAIVISLLTISWQSWKTASKNPVEALRYE